MRKTNKRYVIYTGVGTNIAFFFAIGDNRAFLTSLFPRVFSNKKKAKRYLKRLNSYHKAPYQWHIMDLNVRNAEWRKKNGKVNIIRLSADTEFAVGE